MSSGNSPVNSYVPYQVVSNNGSEQRAIILKYLRKWPWFVVSISIMLIAAYVVLLFQQPIYKVEAKVLFDDKKDNDVKSVLQENQPVAPKKVIENEVEILRSGSLMTTVVEKLHLEHSYFKKTKYGNRAIYKDSPVQLIVEQGNDALYKKPLQLTFPSNETVQINGANYPLNQTVQTPYGRLQVRALTAVLDTLPGIQIQAGQVAGVAKGLANKMKVEPTSKLSSVIVLTLEDAVAERGEDILNTLIKEYNTAAIVDKNKSAANTLDFLDNRLRMVTGELASVERNVESYKANQGITDLSAQAQTFLQTAKENDSQLNQVNIQLAALNDLQQYINSQSSNRGGTPATVGLSDPVLLSLIAKMSQLELQRNDLSRTVSDENPTLQSLDTQIKTTKKNIIENVQTMKTMLNRSKEGYVAKNTDLESQIRSIPQQERSLMNITREQSIKTSLYNLLLQKREETAMAFAAAVSDSRTISPAESSDTPVKPVKPLFFMLFGLVGLLLPLGVVAGKDLFNNRIMRRQDVEANTAVPILGELSKERQNKALVITEKNRSMIAEQIRTIRTNLQFLRDDPSANQVIMFTSSISGEGKSFISMNLGASLALVNKMTVIIDMDLRIPKLHQLINIDNTPGVSNYILGEASLDEVIQPVPGYKNYFIIPSGTASQNPSELLNDPRLEQMIAELKERFQSIIIDTPPVGLVSDAQVIAPLADTTLYVVRHSVTPKSYLKMIDMLYRENRFNRLNLVLNTVEGEGGYYYGNGNKKNKYYAQADKRNWLPAYQSVRSILKQ
ncbi:GumC family protein [Spirosoma sp. KUDC1026]|uniref:GumC family protein n=1 Tax=Spirosoma sp. KUDC1026 TaxID=2745947 RepID=UPI00159BEC3F|nr:tyrosine-protein kinase [Spirosoma sp. KUDC1026]QKZ11392.1 polysaccharide biosynthesis tyrosine autokinase [Spirosoma sp. KUDC1026]